MQDNQMNPITQRRQRRRGFTLTEIAIVLGIVGLILGAIWVAAAAVYNNLRVSHANTEILQITQAVRALYGNTNSIPASTNQTDVLICSKNVPSDMVNAVCGTPGTLIDPFPQGATGVVTPATADSFTVVMTAVPQSACIDLLMAVGGSNRDPGLFNATAVANGAVAVADAVATASPTAMAVASPALANGGAANGFGGCNVAGNNLKLLFSFGLKS